MWEFPWTTSKSIAGMRAWEEIIKRERGDKKVEFIVPMSWVVKLDVFSDFQLQDPFAISIDGTGERAHLYFVESIQYDFGKGQLKITAVDLGWLQRVQFLLGDEDTDPDNWEDASDEDKDKAYLPDEDSGRFRNRERGKRITRRDRRPRQRRVPGRG